MSPRLEADFVFESTDVGYFFDWVIDISKFNFGIESDCQGIIGR